MDEHTLNEIIAKQISGTATTEDITLLDNWLEESDQNYKTYDVIYNLHQISSREESSFSPDKDQAWQNILDQITISKERYQLRFLFVRYAAAAVIFFLVGLFISNLWNNKEATEMGQHYSTFIVPKGQKSEIVLPDGTFVWLNSGTTLKYSTNFNKENRGIILDGEAFFEVAKDKAHRFTISSGKTSVEVYGTAFNVKNYSNDNQMELSVKEGKVGFLKDGQKVMELTKDDQLVFNKATKDVTLGKTDIEMVTAWKNEELVFNSTSVNDVVKYLERWYGVDIKLENNDKAIKKYTFKVKTESLNELLKLINIMTPIKYSINGKEVTIKYLN